MRRLKLTGKTGAVTTWQYAVLLTESYLTERNLKADQILARLPTQFSGAQRASCQSLFLGALRHGLRIRKATQRLVRKAPSQLLDAALMVAGFELLDAHGEKRPLIVHNAVEQAKALVSEGERRFLNAVLRKLGPALDAHAPEEAATFYSHPDWMVERWIHAFGAANCHRLLQWNQGVPALYARTDRSAETLPQALKPTAWEGFYQLEGHASLAAITPLLEAGTVYIKDPSTRLAPELLNPSSGATVLDLCAAPGGKSFELAHRMEGNGLLVACDLPGPRMEQLCQNIERLGNAFPALAPQVLSYDLLHLDAAALERRGLPTEFAAVLLDAPCSNTGVIQRRTDVKWRLQPEDIATCAELQLKLLTAASRRVQAGGRLVYSTCSIEAEENADVVAAFLASDAGSAFRLLESMQSHSWETGHDGAGIHLLTRTTD